VLFSHEPSQAFLVPDYYLSDGKKQYERKHVVLDNRNTKKHHIRHTNPLLLLVRGRKMSKISQAFLVPDYYLSDGKKQYERKQRTSFKTIRTKLSTKKTHHIRHTNPLLLLVRGLRMSKVVHQTGSILPYFYPKR
jgi:hypothetical protein